MRAFATLVGVIAPVLFVERVADAAADPLVERRPLIVLADGGDPNDSIRPAFLTAFVLYADGTVIRRVGGTTLREIHLSPQSRERFAGVLVSARFRAAASENPVLDVGSREGLPFQTRVVELHTWVDGKRQTMRIVGITTADLERCSGKARCRSPALGKQLAPLPEAVLSSVHKMFHYPLPSGRELCRQAACYSRDLKLPAQDAWTSP